MHTIIARFVVVASLVLAAAGPGTAQAHGDPLIQPGGPVDAGNRPLGQFGSCTLNFILRDARDLYTGTTGRCTAAVGERVATAGREFGTVVFRVVTATSQADSVLTSTTSKDDYALIRIDRSQRHRVSPVVLDVGISPLGLATSDQTSEGSLVFMTGQGFGLSQWPTRHRIGPLVSDDPGGYRALYPSTLGDGGAPVLTQDFHAYGVQSSSIGLNGAFGMTMTRVLELLADNGYDLELITAYG